MSMMDAIVLNPRPDVDPNPGGGAPGGGNEHDWVPDEQGQYHDLNDHTDPWVVENARKNANRINQPAVYDAPGSMYVYDPTTGQSKLRSGAGGVTQVGTSPGGIGGVGGAGLLPPWPDAGVGAGGSPTATIAGKDALARIKQLIADYGLPEALGEWAWQEMLQGKSADEVTLDLRSRPEFQTRFPAIKARVDKGLAPLSPAEYINYEKQYRQTLMAAGLPPSFYDEPSDTTDFLVGDVSLSEVAARIERGFIAVKQAPKEVRDAFAELYGADGDAALASYVLDRTRSVTALEKAVASSQAAGTGWRYGFGLTKTAAESLGDRGLSQGALDQGFGQLQDLSSLFSESVSESQDFTATGEGMSAIFGASKTAQDALKQRVTQRSNQAKGTAGAATDSRGVYGASQVT